MPLLALLVERRHVAQYGSVYAIGNTHSNSNPSSPPPKSPPLITPCHPPLPAQTSVALAYSLGPLSGGYLVQYIGFKVLNNHLNTPHYLKTNSCRQSKISSNNSNLTLSRPSCGSWVSSTSSSAPCYFSSGLSTRPAQKIRWDKVTVMGASIIRTH